jgi:predicted nucleic acid-binding protein
VSAIFADTFYFLALLDQRDAFHGKALRFASTHRGALVTTRWVCAEVANALGQSPIRIPAGRFIQKIAEDPAFQVVAGSDRLYDAGLALYIARPDKAWSLTDCISFVVMREEGLSKALTGDRHFEQAGFVALLAS